MCNRGPLSVLTLTVCCLLLPALAAADTSATPAAWTLAGRYPNSQLILQMAARGAHDYGLITRAFPEKLDAAVAGGFTAYQLPAGASVLYHREDSTKFTVMSQLPVYSKGHQQGLRTLSYRFPPTVLYREDFMYSMEPPLKVKMWSFSGAQYLHAGHSMEELNVFLQRERIGKHLLYAAWEYIAAFQPERMPANLAELEAFQGLARNPAAWANVQVVDALDKVALQPGNLYVGPDSRGLPAFGGKTSTWVIAINIGPEIQEWPFAHYPDEPASQPGRMRWNLGITGAFTY